MRRQMVLYAVGMVISGAYLTSILYTFMYGSKIGNTPIHYTIGWLSLAYVVIATYFNITDRRRK